MNFKHFSIRFFFPIYFYFMIYLIKSRLNKATWSSNTSAQATQSDTITRKIRAEEQMRSRIKNQYIINCILFLIWSSACFCQVIASGCVACAEVLLDRDQLVCNIFFCISVFLSALLLIFDEIVKTKLFFFNWIILINKFISLFGFIMI